MTNGPTASSHSSEMDTDRQDTLNEIAAKWSKFSRRELTDIKTNDDLVDRIVTKYGVKKESAQRAVDILMDGRSLGA